MSDETTDDGDTDAPEQEIPHETLAEWSIYQYAQAAQWQSDGHLYHYTDIGGLKGILDSGQLWGTHAAYLNDSQEFSYGVDAICDLIKKYADYVKSPEAADQYGTERDLLSTIITGVQQLVLGSKDVLEEELGPFVHVFLNVA
jgi:hypothetical protein